MIRRSAFTLIELLAVISIIVLLISILSPTLRQARKNGRMAVCLSGLHQMGIAWTTYNDESKGVIMGASTQRADYDWVVTPPAPVLPSNETIDNLKAGRMYAYLGGDTKIYRCPDDPRPDYLRSYSMSNSMGGLAGWGIVSRTSIYQVQKQEQTILLIEEPDPRGYNWGSWVINPKGSPAAHQWIDWAGSFHSQSTTVSFADSHAEYWVWQDPRTPQIDSFYAATPNNVDLVRLQEGYTP